MHKRWKKNNGITIVSLTMVVMVLIIVSTVMLLNVKDKYSAQEVDKLANDLQLLAEKTSIYYVENKKYPILGDGENITIDGNSISVYEIDLTKLKGLTLNYGSKASTDDYYVIDISNGRVYYKPGIEGIYSLIQAEKIVGIEVVKITKQPQWRNVLTGETVTFTVEVDNTSGLTYQWYEVSTYEGEGTEIEGATESTLTIQNVTLDNAKYYYCKITNNSNGIVKKSNVAKLTIKNNEVVNEINEVNEITNDI